MIPAPDRKLVLRWMEGCSVHGTDIMSIVDQVAIKVAAWGYLQQKPEPFRKPNELLEWHHVSYRADFIH
jgi:hypothetical protein